MIRSLSHEKGETWLLGLIYSEILESFDYCLGILRINQIGYDIQGWGFGRGTKGFCSIYKRDYELKLFDIKNLFLFSKEFYSLVYYFLALVTMTQGQLIGTAGEMKNGEGTRKRLKIFVPHFDNYDLIKSYSKTLIGHCMNRSE